MFSVVDLLQWTEWRPLQASSRGELKLRLPRLYRIRRVGRNDLDYIGQTSLPLSERLTMLKGTYADEMPYRDPHTAAPVLWALRHATGCDFEASVTPVEGSTSWRKGLEALAISLYRQEFGQSPTVEFGRMPIGYLASSGNNARLVRLGKRFRGGPATESDASHLPSVPPIGPLTGAPQGPNWGGHVWSKWVPLGEVARHLPAASAGLYRIRGGSSETLLYVGQGLIPDRPLAHFAKMRIADHPQGLIFLSEPRLECSWVLNEAWLPHQRLELENDLIAAHILETGEIPKAQFLG